MSSPNHSRVIFLLALLTMAAVPAFQQPLSPGAVVDVVAGLIDGVVGRDDLEELKGCFKGTDDIARLLNVAVEEFKSGGVMGMSTAILETGKLIQKLPESLQRCVNISNDVQRFVSWSSIFLKPDEIV